MINFERFVPIATVLDLVHENRVLSPSLDEGWLKIINQHLVFGHLSAIGRRSRARIPSPGFIVHAGDASSIFDPIPTEYWRKALLHPQFSRVYGSTYYQTVLREDLLMKDGVAEFLYADVRIAWAPGFLPFMLRCCWVVKRVSRSVKKACSSWMSKLPNLTVSVKD